MMKVIPVIDILNGVAVHGMRGERKQYKPLKSVLCRSVDPIDIALTYESLGFRNLYLADLDAILGKSFNLSIYRQIMTETGLDLMVDAGVASLDRAEEVLSTEVSKVVVGSETLESFEFLGQAIKALGKDRFVVSIDIKEGKVMSASEAIAAMDAVSFAQRISKIGVNQVILLDLTRVGTQQGVNFVLLRSILEKTRVEVLVGGGIRSLKELEGLEKLGVSGALLATILHNGKIQVDKLKSANLL